MIQPLGSDGFGNFPWGLLVIRVCTPILDQRINLNIYKEKSWICYGNYYLPVY